MPTNLLSIGELIDQTWERYRDNFLPLMSLSGWTVLVALLNVISIAFYPSASKMFLNSGDITQMETFGIVLYALTSFIIAPLMNTFVFVSVIRMAKSLLSNRGAAVKRSISEVKTRFLPAVVISFMYLIILFLAALLPLLPAGVFGLLSLILQNNTLLTVSNILLALGIFVSAYLVIRWGIQYYFASYLVIQDDEKIKVSLMSSRRLVDKRFWSVSLRLIAPKILFLLFGVLMIWILNFLVTIVFSGVSGLNLDLQARLLSYTDSVIPILATIFVQPLIILSDVVLIKSLKGE